MKLVNRRITIDVASKKIGVAFQSYYPKIKEYSKMSMNFEIKTLYRIDQDLMQAFKDLLVFGYEELEIVFETPKAPFAGHRAYAKQKQALQMIIDIIGSTNNARKMTYYEVTASQWKKFYNFDKKTDINPETGKVYTQKEFKNQSIRICKEHGFEVKTDDEADAMLMLLVWDKLATEGNTAWINTET